MAIYNGKEILFNPQLKVGASDYDELANKPIINQDLSADGFTPEAGTYYRHIGTGGGGTPAPVNPIAVGDTITQLYFNTSVTPDFSLFDWENPTRIDENGFNVIDLIDTNGNDMSVIQMTKETLAGFDFNVSDDQYQLEFGQAFYITDEAAPLFGIQSGWNYSNSSEYMTNSTQTVSAINAQDIWGAYISKDGQWTSGGSAYTTGAIYYYDGSELKMLGGGGEKGDQGETGLTALEYGDTHTEQYEGDIADEPISLPVSGFNRTPVVGDKFLLVYNVTESGNSYIAPFTITEVGTDTAKASLNGASSQNITGAAGTTDYNQIENIPVINQDLSASGFTPTANTYYRHTGTTGTYTQGVIYYYDGTEYKALDGSGGGGLTLNRYTYVGRKRFTILKILQNAKSIVSMSTATTSPEMPITPSLSSSSAIQFILSTTWCDSNNNLYVGATSVQSGNVGDMTANDWLIKKISADGTIQNYTWSVVNYSIVYYNDTEIT